MIHAPATLAACLAAALAAGACRKQEPAPAPAPSAAAPAAAAPAAVAPTVAAPAPAAPAPEAPAAAAPSLPPAGTAPAPVMAAKEIAPMWDIKIKTLKGQDTTLAAFQGKALMLVNVASKCGLTPQYETLEALQKKYAPRGFTVVGFPCNQFGGQEPGTAEEIQQFCATTYGVTFPMMEKIEVNGTGRHPIYQALTQIADASGHQGDIRWNFEKFVVSADGTRVTRFSPKTTPDDPTVIAAVEAALPAGK
jgi:glutathione peroxidase